MEDKEIIQRVKDGDTNAFGLLMEKYGGGIYSLAIQMTGNRHDADDVYQEAFQRAFKYLDGYNDDYSFYTWLHKITVNEIYKLRKKKGKIHHHEVSTDEEYLDAFVWDGSKEGDESEDMEYRELYAKLMDSLHHLSENKQSVFMLRVFQGIPLKNIAEILNLTVDNVKILLYRARQEMAKHLKGYKKK